jgi:ADP-ribose pyrophosphatase YjhB (NUDIX family)
MLKRFLSSLYRLAPTSLTNRAANFFQTHFTVTVAAVVVDERGRVLLLKHRFRGGSGWGIPGGFLNRGEQPEEALKRELREEVGLGAADLRLMLVRVVKTATQVQVIFTCREEGEPEPRSVEVESCDWFDPEDLPRELPRSQRAIIKRVLSSRS